MEPLFSVLLFIGTFVMSQLNKVDNQTEIRSVQGVSTTSLPTSTPSPSSSPTPTQPIVKKIVMPLLPTPQKREVGAWYWREELGRAQRWLGLDKDGKDIWTDSGDPTPTPTPQPQQQRSHVSSPTTSTVQSSQESYGTSSMGTGVSMSKKMTVTNTKSN